MRRFLPGTPFQFLALAGLAVLAALISNAVGAPARRLAWRRSPSPALASPPPATRTEPPSVQVIRPIEVHQATRTQRTEPPVRPPAPSREKEPSPEKIEAKTPSQPIQIISSQEAWKAFQSGVPFLDARRSSDYLEGHVTGAWCVPVWEADVDDRLLSFKAARHPGSDDPIVIYCSGGECRDSHLLADKLLSEGYFHLLIYHDGFPDWVARKRPVEKGQP